MFRTLNGLPVLVVRVLPATRVLDALDQQADRQALDQLPEQVQLIATAAQARTTASEAGAAYNQARGQMRERETVLPPPGAGATSPKTSPA